MTEPIFKPAPHVVMEVMEALPTDYKDYGIQLMNVPTFWAKTEGEGIKIAVLDTGVDANHPDLKNQILIAKNFTTADPNDYVDRQGHGTHCAGIVAASADGAGIVGTAPKAKLVIGKVLGDSGSGEFSAITAGIRWAIEQDVDIISMSLGCSKQFGEIPELHAAIKEAYAAGIEISAAAGNEGVNNPAIDTTGYPGAYPETWCVAAVDEMKKHASFSSEGAEVDVCAPGVQVISTFPESRYVRLSGTSMATPYFAGVLALLIADFKNTNNRKPTHEELQTLVQVHCEPAGDPGKDVDYGLGFFNFAYTNPDGLEK